MSDFYPILLRLKGKPVLVIGGGKVAERKVESLLKYSAKVFLVSRGLTPGLQKLLDENKIVFLGQEFCESYLDGKFLVIVATNDPLFNRSIADKARQKGVLVNVVDQPSDCDFIVPSVVKRGDLIISISTSGKIPFISKKIREKLESMYGSEHRIALEIMATVRQALIRAGKQDKEKVYEKLYNSDILRKIKSKDVEGVVRIIARALC